VDVLLRKRLERLQITSANTLKVKAKWILPPPRFGPFDLIFSNELWFFIFQSLGNLLDQITNIVVRDEVGEEVERSVSALKQSYAEGRAGNLEGALRHAIISYKASETAFHHPSNLAQLYFPDDQKYAIYIPLFLPVGIPVLFSLRSIFAFLKKKP